MEPNEITTEEVKNEVKTEETVAEAPKRRGRPVKNKAEDAADSSEAKNAPNDEETADKAEEVADNVCPECDCDCVSDEEVAKVAFEAYNKQAGGKTHDGKDIPPFEEVGEKVQKNWVAAVVAVINLFAEKHAPHEDKCLHTNNEEDKKAVERLEVQINSDCVYRDGDKYIVRISGEEKEFEGVEAKRQALKHFDLTQS